MEMVRTTNIVVEGSLHHVFLRVLGRFDSARGWDRERQVTEKRARSTAALRSVEQHASGRATAEQIGRMRLTRYDAVSFAARDANDAKTEALHDSVDTSEQSLPRDDQRHNIRHHKRNLATRWRGGQSTLGRHERGRVFLKKGHSLDC